MFNNTDKSKTFLNFYKKYVYYILNYRRIRWHIDQIILHVAFIFSKRYFNAKIIGNLDKNNYEKHNIESMNPKKWEADLKLLNFDIIHSGYFGPISFWVEKEERNNISKLCIYLIKQCTRVFRKIIKANHGSYSPYCGIIARKKA